MSGFYGKIIQEAIKGWRGFRMGNHDKKGETFPDDGMVPDDSESIYFDAYTTQDEGYLASGNRWIQMTDGGKRNSCFIYHGPPGGEETEKVLSIQNINQSLDANTKQDLQRKGKQLQFGTAFDISETVYDKAGHRYSDNTETLVMPDIPPIAKLEEAVEELQYATGTPIPEEEDPGERGLLRRVTRLEELSERYKELETLVNGEVYEEPVFPGEDPPEEEDSPPGTESELPCLEDETRALRNELGDTPSNTPFMSKDIYEFFFGPRDEYNATTYKLTDISNQNYAGLTFTNLIGNIDPGSLPDEIAPYKAGGGIPSKGVIVTIFNNFYNAYKAKMELLDSKDTTIQGQAEGALQLATATADRLGYPYDGVLHMEASGIYDYTDKMESRLNTAISTETTNRQNAIAELTGTHNTDKKALNDRIDALTSTHNTDKAALEKSIQNLTNTHNTDKGILESSISTLNQTLTKKIADEKLALQGEIDSDVEIVRADLQGKIDVANANISSNYNTLDSKIDGVTESISSNVKTLEGKITTAQSAAEATASTALQKVQKELDGKISTNTSSISTINGQISDINGQLDTINESLGKKLEETDIADLKSQVSSLQETVGQLQTQVSGFEERIAALEEQLSP